MIIVTSYENPDLDGVGCAYGYAELLCAQGKEAVPAIYGQPFVEARWLLDAFHIPTPKSTRDFDIANHDVVVVDTSGDDPIDPQIDDARVIEIIDHHKNNQLQRFPNAQVQIEHLGAAATLVAERMKNAGHTPSLESAMLLLGGIISNTMNFCSSNVTPKDRDMHDWLWGIAKPSANFAHEMFHAKTALIHKDLDTALRTDGLFVTVDDVRITQIQLELVDVADLLTRRRDELSILVKRIKEEGEARFALLSCVDVDKKTTDILVFDAESRGFYTRALGFDFSNGHVHLDHILLRKQMIIPIKETLAQ